MDAPLRRAKRVSEMHRGRVEARHKNLATQKAGQVTGDHDSTVFNEFLKDFVDPGARNSPIAGGEYMSAARAEPESTSRRPRRPADVERARSTGAHASFFAVQFGVAILPQVIADFQRVMWALNQNRTPSSIRTTGGILEPYGRFRILELGVLENRVARWSRSCRWAFSVLDRGPDPDRVRRRLQDNATVGAEQLAARNGYDLVRVLPAVELCGLHPGHHFRRRGRTREVLATASSLASIIVGADLCRSIEGHLWGRMSTSSSASGRLAQGAGHRREVRMVSRVRWWCTPSAAGWRCPPSCCWARA